MFILSYLSEWAEFSFFILYHFIFYYYFIFCSVIFIFSISIYSLHALFNLHRNPPLFTTRLSLSMSSHCFVLFFSFAQTHTPPSLPPTFTPHWILWIIFNRIRNLCFLRVWQKLHFNSSKFGPSSWIVLWQFFLTCYCWWSWSNFLKFSWCILINISWHLSLQICKLCMKTQ